MTGGLTESDRKRLKLMGITKAARDPMFNGQSRKRERAGFDRHVCHSCGTWVDCWLDPCPHVTCVLAKVPGCEHWIPETAARML